MWSLALFRSSSLTTFPLWGFGFIPDDDEVPRYLAQELPQETGDIASLDVLPRELEVERQVLAHGAHRDGRDRAYPAVREAWTVRVSAPGRPGSPDRGNEEKPGLVHKRYVCAQG